MSTEDREVVQKNEYHWTPNKENTSWTLHMWPFYLVIEYRPREAQPYVGSLAGKLITLRDFHSWATVEEASMGMVQWGLMELSKSYHELAKLAPQPTQHSAE